MNKFLIGLSGKARHGKDTVCDELRALMPRDSDRYGFADPVKAVGAVLGMKEKDGAFLQALGTDVFRRINTDVWVNVAKVLVPMLCMRRIVIISDVRFENEARWIRDSGGVLVRVTRLNDDGSRFVSPDRPADHPSETGLDHWTDWDYTLYASEYAELLGCARRLAPELQQKAGLYFAVRAFREAEAVQNG